MLICVSGNPLEEPQKSLAAPDYGDHSPKLLAYLQSESSKHRNVKSMANPNVESKSVAISSVNQSVSVECYCGVEYSHSNT